MMSELMSNSPVFPQMRRSRNLNSVLPAAAGYHCPAWRGDESEVPGPGHGFLSTSLLDSAGIGGGGALQMRPGLGWAVRTFHCLPLLLQL